MALSITYKGAIGRRLTWQEVDANMLAFAEAIVALQTDRPVPVSIAAITVDGRNMKIVLDDSTEIGPLPLPVLEFRHRDEWTPFTPLASLDWFTVSGKGIYVAMADHETGAIFDETLLVGGKPAYKKLFGPDAGSIANSILADLGFFYPGRPSDSTNPLLFDFPLLRATRLPVSGDQHEATLTEAPSTAAQIYPILHDGTHLGDVTFAIAAETGVWSWLIGADELLARGEHLQVGKPAITDATAAGLAINFALQRVL